MPGYFSVFVEAPFNQWDVLTAYNSEIAVEPPQYSVLVELQTSGAGEKILAACTGKLAIAIQPSLPGSIQPIDEDPSNVAPLPVAVDLFLVTDSFIDADPALKPVLGNAGIIGNPEPFIAGFYYSNVSVAGIMDYLQEQLLQSTLPAGDAGAGPDEIERLMRLFLRAEIELLVEKGATIGTPALSAAGNSYSFGFGISTSSGACDPGEFYTAVNNFTNSPAEVAQFLAFLPPQDNPLLMIAKNQAIQLTAVKLFSWETLLTFYGANTFARNLTRSEWRQVGDNQKALYRKRLLARTGHLPAGEIADHFLFNNLDWQNLFQLEAIVEYYANHPQPWSTTAPFDTPMDPPTAADPKLLQGNAATMHGAGAAAVVRLDGNPDLSVIRKFSHFIYLQDANDVNVATRMYPIIAVNNAGTKSVTVANQYISPAKPVLKAGSVNTPWQIRLYNYIDFIPPGGSAATIADAANFIIQLDGQPDLTSLTTSSFYQATSSVRITNEHVLCDCIRFEAEPDKLYQIVHADPLNYTITLDSLPVLGASSKWVIEQIPVLVQIDAFGPRTELSGVNATVVSADTIQIDEWKAAFEKLNKYDTIYLPGDSASPRKTYFIKNILPAEKRLQLSGSPVFASGSSEWSIPAGISGELDKIKYKLGPGAEKGFDHYDGCMLVVYNQQVRVKKMWTSYTSRVDNEAGNNNRRSVQGNIRYDILSFFSDGEYKNYSFAVRNTESSSGDKVFNARSYFDTSTDEGGQRSIRLHYGNINSENGGTGSKGCNVSCQYYDIRSDLIDCFQQMHRGVYGAIDDAMQRLYNKNHKESGVIRKTELKKKVNGQEVKEPNPDHVPSEDWRFRIYSKMWLIRPDERHNGHNLS